MADNGVARQLLARFYFGVDTGELDRGKKKLGDFFADLKKLGAGLAGGAIAARIGSFVKDTVEEMMDLRKGAAELSITTDELQGLQIAAKAAGLDTRWLAMSIERLQVNVERAARGGKNQVASMHLLGLTTKDAAGKTKSATELFLEAADGIHKMTDANKQAIAVRDMFGIGGHRLLPVLRMGRAAIEDLMNITKEYGKYDEKVIEQSAKFTIVMLKLEAVWRGIKSFIMSQWLPILEKQTEGLIKIGKWFMGLAKNSLAAEAALRLLQVAMVGLGIKTLMAYPQVAAIVAGLTALWVIVDDLMVLFRGGDSEIGDLLDKMFGKGTSVQWVQDMKDGLREIVRLLGEAWGLMKKILGIPDDSPAKNFSDSSDAPRQSTAQGYIGADGMNYTPDGNHGWREPIVRMFNSNSPDFLFKPDIGVTRDLISNSLSPGPIGTPLVQIDNLNLQMSIDPSQDAAAQGKAAGHAAAKEIKRVLKDANATRSRRVAK